MALCDKDTNTTLHLRAIDNSIVDQSSKSWKITWTERWLKYVSTEEQKQGHPKWIKNEKLCVNCEKQNDIGGI